MPSIPLHPRVVSPNSPSSPSNPLPQLLQTPSGLAILELQGTINVPSQGNQEDEFEPADLNNNPHDPTIPAFETPIGKLMFPDHSPQTSAEDTKWMKRVYLYVGRYQRMTGEVKKLAQPLAVVQKRQNGAGSDDGEELEIVEIVKYKLLFKNRPEPVSDN